MIAAQRLGSRVILHIHGAKFDEFYAAEPSWRRRLIGWALTRADRVVALSAHWRQTLSAMSPRARIVVVENAGHASREPGTARELVGACDRIAATGDPRRR